MSYIITYTKEHITETEKQLIYKHNTLLTMVRHEIKGNPNKSFAQIETNAIFIFIINNDPKIEQIYSIHSKMGRII